MRKSLFFRIATAFVAALLSLPVFAQEEVISKFPYEFSGYANENSDTISWWRRYFCYQEDEYTWRQDPNPSVNWSFSQGTDFQNDGYFPVFKMQNEEEYLSAIFTPQFALEKSEDVEYVVKYRFFVPAGHLPVPEETFIARLHPVTAGSNECAELYDEFDYDYASETVMAFEDKSEIQSIWLRNFVNTDERTDFVENAVEEKEFRLSGSALPHTGDYRFSVIRIGNKTKPPVIYLAGFSVEKKAAGADLAAAQLISPLSAVSDDDRPVSFFVYNNSASAVSSFEAGYQLDNSEIIPETFNLSVLPFNSARITFSEERKIEPGEHTLRFWVKADGDVNAVNDTAVYRIKVGDAIPAAHAAFTFASGESVMGWTVHSDSIETAPFWHFTEPAEEGGTHKPEAETNGHNREASHDDYLVSPYMAFEQNKVYTIKFSYTPDQTDNNAKKNFSVWLCNTNGRDEVYSDNKNRLWAMENINRDDRREMTVFYISPDNHNACVALRSYGGSVAGSIRLDTLIVAESNIIEGELLYDFESYNQIDVQTRAANHMIFVDQDGNLSNDISPQIPSPSTWEVVRTNYSEAHTAYCRGITGKANDWLVFRPVYLEKDSTYHFSLSARKEGTDKPDVELEFYLQKSVPQYDLAYDRQNVAWKQKETLSATSFKSIKHDDVKVDESGLYFLSIRNVTEVASDKPAADAEAAGVYVDNVALTTSVKTSVQAVSAQIPYIASLGRRASMSVTVKNFSPRNLEVTCCYRFGSGNAVKEKPMGKIPPMDPTTYDFDAIDFKDKEDCTVYFWVETEGSEDPVDTVKVEFKRVYPKQLPYEEDFSARTFDEWQEHQTSNTRAWSITQSPANVYSGGYALSCNGTVNGTSVDLVTPILQIEANTPYRIAFRYKRASKGSGDKLRLYYAEDNFEDGFAATDLLKEFVIDSSQYTLCEAYVRFPKDGDYFLSLQTALGTTAPTLYLDDFSVADSVQAISTQLVLSALTLPDNLSSCDTAHNAEIRFRVRNRGFLEVENIRVSYSIDGGAPVRSTLEGLGRNDSNEYSLKLGRMTQGTHAIEVYADMRGEGDRTDDTLGGEFRVTGPVSYPFSENFEGIMRGTGAVDINGDGLKWEVKEDAANAYGGTHCLVFNHRLYAANDVFFTNGFTVTEADLAMFEEVGKKPVLWVYAKGSALSDEKVGVRLMKYGADGGFASDQVLDSISLTVNYKLYTHILSFEPGTYAIAFDFASEATRQAIYIDSIRVGFAPEPKPVTNLTYVARMGTMVAFSAQGGEAVNEFQIRKEDSTDIRTYPWEDLEIFTLDLRELDSNSTYIARARSINETGDAGAWSNEVSFKSLFGAEPDPGHDTTGDNPDTNVHVRVEAPVFAGSMKVWPNPAVSVLNVEMPGWAEKWEMYDMTGRMHRSGSGRESVFQIRLEGLRPGTYLLRVSGRGENGRLQTVVTKVIKR